MEATVHLDTRIPFAFHKEQKNQPAKNPPLWEDVTTAALYTIKILGALYLAEITCEAIFEFAAITVPPSAFYIAQGFFTILGMVLIATIWLGMAGVQFLE